MEISIIIASLVANMMTKFVKPAKDNLNEGELEKRKATVRAMNALFGLVALIVSYALVGGELDVSQVSTYVEILVGAVITFAGSQGWYFLAKK